MGFSTSKAQVLLLPPYLLAGCYACFIGWLADRWRNRYFFLIGNSALTIIGLATMSFPRSPGVRLFGVFLTCLGSKADYPSAMTYQANNVRGHTQRLVGGAMIGLAVTTGGVIGSLTFRSQDSPHYRLGIYSCMTANAFIIAVVGLLTIRFNMLNKRVERGEAIIMGEPTFRYTMRSVFGPFEFLSSCIQWLRDLIPWINWEWKLFKTS